MTSCISNHTSATAYGICEYPKQSVLRRLSPVGVGREEPAAGAGAPSLHDRRFAHLESPSLVPAALSAIVSGSCCSEQTAPGTPTVKAEELSRDTGGSARLMALSVENVLLIPDVPYTYSMDRFLEYFTRINSLEILKGGSLRLEGFPKCEEDDAEMRILREENPEAFLLSTLKEAALFQRQCFYFKNTASLNCKIEEGEQGLIFTICSADSFTLCARACSIEITPLNFIKRMLLRGEEELKIPPFEWIVFLGVKTLSEFESAIETIRLAAARFFVIIDVGTASKKTIAPLVVTTASGRPIDALGFKSSKEITFSVKKTTHIFDVSEVIPLLQAKSTPEVILPAGRLVFFNLKRKIGNEAELWRYIQEIVDPPMHVVAKGSLGRVVEIAEYVDKEGASEWEIVFSPKADATLALEVPRTLVHHEGKSAFADFKGSGIARS